MIDKRIMEMALAFKHHALEAEKNADDLIRSADGDARMALVGMIRAAGLFKLEAEMYRANVMTPAFAELLAELRGEANAPVLH
ncbi:hypothetical protein [Labrys monachus]|uniref:Uncharacterized protein n=1 Tax=Labrys monachus TaxID=217067 RepID=A0ABU0FDB0_9HYPH|nr:hypothetical protein [Labrys monachus]MDQ0392588.1 hypothetical protein [Labrys monachus]